MNTKKIIVFLLLFTIMMMPICAHALTTTASPGAGVYNSTQNVTLTADLPSVIFYTTDGTTPTKNSPRYNSPISISATTTLKFFAVDTNDNAENIKTATYTFDTIQPTGSITINNGEDVVEQTKVTLTLTCSDANGCAKMMVSNDVNFTGATEESYVISRGWTLLSGDGAKTVYVKFKDGAGNWSVPYSDTIILDTTMPIGEPIDFLPKTGQTKCYDQAGAEIACAGTGQDGELQKGITWPDPRFTNPDGTTPVNGNIILDKLTGLEWLKDAGTPTVGSCTGGTKTWQGALDYVSCLNQNNYLGYNDWRLPNILELESLVDLSKSNPALPAGHPFTNPQSFNYWSSSTNAFNTASAWYVYMNSGSVSPNNKSDSYYVWPVRSGQSGSLDNSVISLSKTGQTTSYATGDDGDLEKGLAWASPRFTDNGNGTATDNLTGLIWLKNANCFGGKVWEGAITGANGLKNGDCGLTDGSNAGDWRLPNRKELLSLVGFSKSNPVLPASHPFTNVQSYNYWSSSTVANNTGYAWDVPMYFGYVDGSNKSYYDYVWPVRSGQNARLFGNLGILVSQGASVTKDASVNLLLSASHANGVAEMSISNDASFNNAVTVPYATTKSWVLSSGDGTKTVYVKFKANGNATWSRVYSDSITLDTTAPVTTVNPTGGLYSLISVTLTANETAKIYYTTDGSTPTTNSTVYSTPISVSSNITLKFFAVDTAGNVEDIKTETYTIDTTLPAGTIAINNGVAAVNNTTVTLNLTAKDSTGVTEMKLRNENTTEWSGPEPYATSKNWTLSSGDGAKTVYVKFKDTAGNWSISESYTITLDTTPPSLILSTLSNGSFTNNPTLNVAGSVSDNVALEKLTVNNTEVTIKPDGSFSYAYVLTQGENTITIIAQDTAGNEKSDIRTITYDTTLPAITINPITTPTSKNSQIISGSMDEGAVVTVSCPSAVTGSVEYPTSTTWKVIISSLTEGDNQILIIIADKAGNTTETKKTIFYNPALFTLDLVSGWNFISLQKQPENPAIGEVFKDISPNIRIIWGYNNETKTWLKFKPSAISNELSTIEYGKGYWIYVDEAATLTLAGQPESLQAIPLYSGWNLVGYSGPDGKDAGESLSGIAGKWIIIWGWEDGQWYVKQPTATTSHILPLTYLYKGKAYWIKVKEAVNWLQ